ncbi:MAG: ankyrin repeat domain-containing protein, partial [Planctomycetaceae bacterium]|nr:ankyrin repeat domain-containing protein [Planctomycetaceae bacterium]
LLGLLSLLSLSCWIEGIIYLTMKKSAYDKRYNETTPGERLRPVKEFVNKLAEGIGNIICFIVGVGFIGSLYICLLNAVGDTAATVIFCTAVIVIVAIIVFKKPKNKDIAIQLNDAASEGRLDTVKYLIDHGADVNVKYNNDGWTPLTFAANKGHLDVVKYLIDHGADVNVKFEEGNTPLIFAAVRGHLDTVKYLIDHRADVNAKNNYGNTPLDYAKTDEIKKVLRDAGGKSGSEIE